VRWRRRFLVFSFLLLTLFTILLLASFLLAGLSSLGMLFALLA
jgi:hypothetical protein